MFIHRCRVGYFVSNKSLIADKINDYHSYKHIFLFLFNSNSLHITMVLKYSFPLTLVRDYEEKYFQKSLQYLPSGQTKDRIKNNSYK